MNKESRYTQTDRLSPQCNQCEDISDLNLSLENHLSPNHAQEGTDQSSNHRKADLTTEFFKCDKCASTFSSDDELLGHIESIHGESTSIFKCDICDQSFRSKEHLQEHTSANHGQSSNTPKEAL